MKLQLVMPTCAPATFSRRTLRAVLWLAAALLAAHFADAGSLSGRVSSQSGAFLPNVFIDIYDEQGDWFDFTVTDANGRYQLANLGEGVFYVHTDTLGNYADEWYDNVPGASDRAFFDPLAAGATPIDVAITATVTEINAVLEPAASVLGSVQADGGGAITNVYVDTYLPDGTRFRSALTAEDGTYVIDGLPGGMYAVRTDTIGAYKDEWHDQTDAFDGVSPQDAGVAPLTVAAGATIGGIAFSLSPGGSLEGAVRTDTGSAVPGAFVDLYDPGGARLEFDRTDANGVFRLAGLPAGTYHLATDTLGSYIDLWYEQKIILHPGQPLLDAADPIVLPEQGAIANLLFTLEAGAEIAGRVETEEGAPVPDAFVDAFLDDSFFDYAITAADGAFRVPALPDGVYYLKTYTFGELMDEWYEDHVVYDIRDPIGDGADPLVVAGGVSVTGLVLRLQRGAEILGRVTETGGSPVTNVYVDLYSNTGDRLFYTRNDAAGEYRLGGLPANTYYLRTDAVASFVDEWFDDRIVFHPKDPAADQAAPLTVSGTNRLENTDLVLARGGAISGAVTGPGGDPVRSGWVEAFYGNVYYDLVGIDTNGAYQVAGLPAGVYYLQTDVNADLVNEWYEDVYIFRQGLPEEDGATAIPLGAEQNMSGVNFELGYGGNIEGVVRNEDGPLLADVFVDLYDAQERFYDFALTLQDGSFLLELLPPGVWYAGTDTFGEYTDEWYDDVVRDLGDPIDDGATPLDLEDGVALVGVNFVLTPAPPIAARITSIVRDGASVLIEWYAQEDVAYQVERLTDLASRLWADAPGGSVAVEESLKEAGPAGVRQYRDPQPPAQGALYRVGAF